MKNDFHLVLTEIPVTNGWTYEGLCGAEIPRAKFGFVWDSIDMMMSARMMTLRGICNKCWQAFLARPDTDAETKLRYLSAIRSAKKEEQENEAA
jgi:hypothetical protein